ncbi:MAG: hypothetical protein R2704_16220 [Microthrixaceae bacterium]
MRWATSAWRHTRRCTFAKWRTLGYLGFAARYPGCYLAGRAAGRGHHDAYLHLSAECEAEFEAQRLVRGLPTR